MELADRIDEMVLCSGNGDFRPLVEPVQRHGVRVTVVSSLATQPSTIADELRREADVFCDIRELRSRIGRDRSERALSRIVRDQAPRLMQRAIARSSDDDEE